MTDFLTLSNLSAIDCMEAKPGTIAFLAQSTIRHIVLFFTDDEGKKRLLDLGGAKPMGIWPVEEGYGPATVIPDWSLEVDPTSAMPTQFSRLPCGCAFAAPGSLGLVGSIQPHGRANLPVTTLGAVAADDIQTHRAAFRRWRIVCGATDDRYVLSDSERCGVPIESA